MDISFLGFIVWALYYVIFKAAMHLLNVETRRSGMHVPAGLSGLLC